MWVAGDSISLRDAVADSFFSTSLLGEFHGRNPGKPKDFGQIPRFYSASGRGASGCLWVPWSQRSSVRRRFIKMQASLNPIDSA
jgi:hypothetical protein